MRMKFRDACLREAKTRRRGHRRAKRPRWREAQTAGRRRRPPEEPSGARLLGAEEAAEHRMHLHGLLLCDLLEPPVASGHRRHSSRFQRSATRLQNARNGFPVARLHRFVASPTQRRKSLAALDAFPLLALSQSARPSGCADAQPESPLAPSAHCSTRLPERARRALFCGLCAS